MGKFFDYFISIFNGKAFLYPDKYIGAIMILCFVVAVILYFIIQTLYKKYKLFGVYVIDSFSQGKLPNIRGFRTYKFDLDKASLRRQQRLIEVAMREEELEEIEKRIQ